MYPALISSIPTTEEWQKIRRMDSKKSCNIINFLEHDGRVATNKKYIAETYQKQSGTENYTLAFSNY